MVERYTKLSKIGSGTFGEAWLVNSVCSGRSYVIKEVRVNDMTEEELIMTQREATVLARCKHINIIRYKESFIKRDPIMMCLVMEYADGGDLFQKEKEAMQMKRRIPEASILNWFIQMIFAVQYLHSNDILHRDLKTQNIFLTRHDIVKVGDFGIARFLRSKQELATTAIGTPYYLSPEICQRKPYNHKSDMWALGCILYELCALKHPFEAGDFENLVIKILSGQYPPLNKFYSKLVHDLTSVLLRTKPEKRPSADQLLLIPQLRNLVKQYIKRHESHITRHSSTVSQDPKDPQEPSERVQTIKAEEKSSVETPIKTSISIEDKSSEPIIASPAISKPLQPSSSSIRVHYMDSRPVSVSMMRKSVVRKESLEENEISKSLELIPKTLDSPLRVKKNLPIETSNTKPNPLSSEQGIDPASVSISSSSRNSSSSNESEASDESVFSSDKSDNWESSNGNQSEVFDENSSNEKESIEQSNPMDILDPENPFLKGYESYMKYLSLNPGLHKVAASYFMQHSELHGVPPSPFYFPFLCSPHPNVKESPQSPKTPIHKIPAPKTPSDKAVSRSISNSSQKKITHKNNTEAVPVESKTNSQVTVSNRASKSGRSYIVSYDTDSSSESSSPERTNDYQKALFSKSPSAYRQSPINQYSNVKTPNRSSDKSTASSHAVESKKLVLRANTPEAFGKTFTVNNRR